MKVLAHRVDNLERAQLRTLVDQLRDKIGSGVVVLGSASDGNVALIVGVTKGFDFASAGRQSDRPCRAEGRRQRRRTSGSGGGWRERCVARWMRRWTGLMAWWRDCSHELGRHCKRDWRRAAALREI